MNHMTQHFLLFLVSNLSVLNFRTFLLMYPGLSFQATDDDTGDFGVDGIQYKVRDSTAVEIDSTGMLYLVKQQYVYPNLQLLRTHLFIYDVQNIW